MSKHVISTEIVSLLGIEHLVLDNLGSVVKIAGKNGAGKSRAIFCLLAALKYDALPKPRKDALLREDGSVSVEIGDDQVDLPGYTVRREFKNGRTSLKVTSTDGTTGGATLVRDFIGSNFVDLGLFLSMDREKKERAVLDALGLTESLNAIDDEYKRLYEQRRQVGSLADAHKPKGSKPRKVERVSVDDLHNKLNAAYQHNAQIDTARRAVTAAQTRYDQLQAQLESIMTQMEELGEEITANLLIANGEPLNVDEIQNSIRTADLTNKQAEDYARWEAANVEYTKYKEQYDELTARIEDSRNSKRTLLDDTQFPVPGLSYDPDKGLLYNGGELISDGQYRRIAFELARALAGDLSIATFENFSLLDQTQQEEIIREAKEAGFQVFCEIVSTSPVDGAFYIEDGELA